MKTVIIKIIAVLCLLPNAIMASENFDREQVEKRIKPVGKVHIQDDDASVVPKAPKQPEESPQVIPGKQIYDQYCMVCHKTGLANAPKFRDNKDWQERSANKNIDELTQSAINGMNAMPAKGTCMQCSDEEIKDAIQYMVPQQ